MSSIDGLDCEKSPVRAKADASTPPAKQKQLQQKRRYRVLVHVDTEFAQDDMAFTVEYRERDSGSNGEATDAEERRWCSLTTVGDLLEQVLERWRSWHSTFPLYELEAVDSAIQLENSCDLWASAILTRGSLRVKESEASVERRREERRRAEEEQRRREEEARKKEEARRKRVAELAAIGRCWILEMYSQHLDVPLDKHGIVVRNKGSMDQWVAIHSLEPIAAGGTFYASIRIAKDPETSNTWRICVGAVPLSYNVNGERRWIGAQKSWGYIAGTGGKCNDSGKSAPYGEPFGLGDTIGILLDFDKGVIEFFKNNKSQGVAFDGVTGPVYLGVSLTATDAEVELDYDSMPDYIAPIMRTRRLAEGERRRRWMRIASDEYREAMLERLRAANDNDDQLADGDDEDDEDLSEDDGKVEEKDEVVQKIVEEEEEDQESQMNMIREAEAAAEQIEKDEEKKSIQESNGVAGSLKKRRTGSVRDNVWDVQFAAMNDRSLYFPDDELSLVLNEGSGDKWRVARSLGAYSKGVQFFEAILEEDPKTANTWRFCLGVVPTSFVSTSNRIWVGAQNSWGYIAGTGGKAYNSGQSTAYGEPFGARDVIGVLLDFHKKTIQFFKNGVSQGVAFTNLEGSVHAAVSMTGTGASVRLVPGDNAAVARYQEQAKARDAQISRVLQSYGNVWDPSRCSKEIRVEPAPDGDVHGTIFKNRGSKDKWCAAAALLSYASGRRYFEVVVLDLPSTTNSWRICVGIVPKTFDFQHSKVWVGAQKSWGYIAGNGGKCYDSGKHLSYGAKYNKGDRVGVLMDFDNNTIEFFKNSESQGIAFSNLEGPVYPAVSLTGKGMRVRIDGNIESSQDVLDRLFLYR